MKNTYALILCCLIYMQTKAQVNNQHIPCITTEVMQEMQQADPNFQKNLDDLEFYTEKYVKDKYVKNTDGTFQKVQGVVRVIPVVFHIIHEGGNENISAAQCQSQIDVLNADFRRLNADTGNTPAPFQAIGGDAEIEFRMAQLDPNGNCTDGIVRLFSTLTNNARNNIKSLSYWPSNKYLNIWVVKSIRGAQPPLQVAGFAQFPGFAASTDGIVICNQFLGTIGTSTGNSVGRTTTHEVGHWLNLIHIWGDDAGACAGSDLVSDTPNQANLNQSNCPNFPHTDACTPTGNGVLYSNYMDYTNGNCQNIFTVGQCARMNAALSSGASQRNNLWSANNLIATGTNGTTPVLCAPIPSQILATRTICAGDNINFAEYVYNGIPTSRNWVFTGGNPATSTNASEIVTYSNPGTYDVSYTATNAAGSNTTIYAGLVNVLPTIGVKSVPYTDGFEGSFPGFDYEVINGEGNFSWEQTSLAAATGTKSIRINNFAGNAIFDEFITPTFNCTNVTNVQLQYKVAFAVRNVASIDNLKVFVSTDCGKSWTLRQTKAGLTLATVSTAVSSAFVPNANQWRQETVNMNLNASNEPNVRFRFQFSYGTNGLYANNIYIDDINISGLTNISDALVKDWQVNLTPNPSKGASTLSFQVNQSDIYKVQVTDVVGKVCQTIDFGKLPSGTHKTTVGNSLTPGLYFVQLINNNKKAVVKLIIE
jgi:PKD repeat protein